MDLKAFSKSEKKTTRVRHYTNRKGSTGIESSGKIYAHDNNRVYVEFDVNDELLEWVENPRYHIQELTIKSDIEITNPIFIRRK